MTELKWHKINRIYYEVVKHLCESMPAGMTFGEAMNSEYVPLMCSFVQEKFESEVVQ